MFGLIPEIGLIDIRRRRRHRRRRRRRRRFDRTRTAAAIKAHLTSNEFILLMDGYWFQC